MTIDNDKKILSIRSNWQAEVRRYLEMIPKKKFRATKMCIYKAREGEGGNEKNNLGSFGQKLAITCTTDRFNGKKRDKHGKMC